MGIFHTHKVTMSICLALLIKVPGNSTAIYRVKSISPKARILIAVWFIVSSLDGYRQEDNSIAIVIFVYNCSGENRNRNFCAFLRILVKTDEFPNVTKITVMKIEVGHI